jgi:protocatechuate 3,4-dioxygenase beta subunit
MDITPNPAPSTMRRWRGRLLPRQDEEVVDQGLSFDVETLLGRRTVLRALGLGAIGLGLAACADDSTDSSSASTTSAGEIPEETAGPYPADGSNGVDVLEETGIVRSDIRSSFGAGSATAEGVPMALELAIADLADDGSAFAGAAVYVWHCDREGRYSMYSEGVEGENYLRGVQVAGDDGVVRFTSIFPACYTGRWPHIHFEVYADQADIDDSSNAIATSQVALPKDVCTAVYAESGYEQSVTNLSQLSLATDNVFADDNAAQQLATVTGDVAAGYKVFLRVGVDITTTPGGSGMAAGAAKDGGSPPAPPN